MIHNVRDLFRFAENLVAVTRGAAADQSLLSTTVDLVLHIGSGKTGTSSIQHFLDANRDAWPRWAGSTQNRPASDGTLGLSSRRRRSSKG